MQNWLLLACAILLEVAGTTSMKLSNGFSELIPSVLLFVFYFLAFTALTFALRTIEIGIAYAVWSGVGIALIAAIGFIYFKEPITVQKVASILLIVIGVVGLNLAAKDP